MITIKTDSGSQEYVIRSEALLGFIIKRENNTNALSVIIEGYGPVKLWNVEDFEKTLKICENNLRTIKNDSDGKYYIKQDIDFEISSQTALSQLATPEQIKHALNKDVKPLVFKSLEKKDK